MPSHRARRRARPSGLRPLAALVLVGGTAAGTVFMRARAQDGAGSAVSSSASSAPSSVVAEEAWMLATALAEVAVEGGAAVAVAVLDVTSGDSAGYGDARFETASIVKLNILAALLLQAQDAGRQLTAREKAQASVMIRDCDNVSATELWNATGLWDINSVGRVSVDGREYLLAVVSAGHTAKAGGIVTVEAAARAAVSVFADTAGAANTTESAGTS